MKRAIPLSLAALPLLITILLLLLLVFVVKLPLYLGLLSGAVLAAIIAYKHDFTLPELRQAAFAGIKNTQTVVIILLTIGALVAVWMGSGTVAGLVYYGLGLVHPGYILVSAFILTALTSMLLGTSIGTLSTMGVALMGIGFSLGVPKPLIAGAVVSGAFFGDRSSPMSSAAHLASTATEVEFNKMLRYMLPTGGLGFGLSLIGYYILGNVYRPAATGVLGLSLPAELAKYFTISPLVLLPALLVILLAVGKVPTKYNLGLGVIAGILVAFWVQKMPVPELARALAFGYKANSGNPTIDAMVKGGGILPMLNLILLILSAGAFNGILSATGMIKQVAEKLLQGVKSDSGIIVATVLFSTATALVACNQALPILMPGQMLRSFYQERRLANLTLARTLTDSGLVISGLVPWNMVAILSSMAIGVSTLEYAPYALLLWLLPLLTILFAYFAQPKRVIQDPPGAK
ncbi:MAG TPA: Na+/H+ antiporter NhaC family protein [Verrucomicrobiae bacterium]|nr:Na+/H+ antiporter NhaC family protein [Verrucomicrobiae bacterium]